MLIVPFPTSAEKNYQVLHLGENQHRAWGVRELLEASGEVAVSQRHLKIWEKFDQYWLMSNADDYDLVFQFPMLLITV